MSLLLCCRDRGGSIAAPQASLHSKRAGAVPGARRADVRATSASEAAPLRDRAGTGVSTTSASITAPLRDRAGADVSTTSASGATPRSRIVDGRGAVSGPAVGGRRGGGIGEKPERASRESGDVSTTSPVRNESGGSAEDALEMARRVFGRAKGSGVGGGLPVKGRGLGNGRVAETARGNTRHTERVNERESQRPAVRVAADKSANRVKQGLEGRVRNSGEQQSTERRVGPRKGGSNAIAEERGEREDESDESLFAPDDEEEGLDDEDGEGERELSAEELAEEAAERAQFTAEELESGRDLEYRGLPIDLGEEAEEALAAQFGVEHLEGGPDESGESSEEVLDGLAVGPGEGLDGREKCSEGFAEGFRDSESEGGGEEWETDEESARAAETEPDAEEGDEQTQAPQGKRSRVLAMLEEVWGTDDGDEEGTDDKAVRFETRGPPKPAFGAGISRENEDVSLEGLTPLERARILFRGGKPALAEGRESPPGEEEDGAERAPARVTSPKWRVTSPEAERDPPRILESSRRKVTTSSAQRKRLGQQKVKKVEPLTTRAQVIERVKQLARDTLHECLQMRLADRLRVDYIVNHCPKFLARQVLLPLAQSQNRSTPPEKQLRALVFGLSGTQLVTAYEEALEITEEQKGLAKRVLASHLHVHRYMEKGMAENIAENCPIFLVEGVMVPASTIPFEALSVVQVRVPFLMHKRPVVDIG